MTEPTQAVAPQPSMVTLGIVDDNDIVRLGLRSLMATVDGVDVVGEATDGLAAVALARSKKPDVMLLDVRMPRLDGVSAAAEISTYSAVVMMTYSEAPEVISAAVRAGAKGYLVHGQFEADELVNAVLMAARGIGVFSAPALRALSEPVRSTADRGRQLGVSEREAQVLELMSLGSTNQEIARELFLSEKTVKNHINHIFAKLGVASRGRAVAVFRGQD